MVEQSRGTSEGYSPVIGDEGAARSLRTRAGLSQLTELQQGKGKVSPQDLRDMLYQRNYAAELLLDDLLVLCANDDELQESCNALKNWDRTMNVGSRVVMWREFWRDASEHRQAICPGL